MGEALGVSGLLSGISGGVEGAVGVLPGPPPKASADAEPWTSRAHLEGGLLNEPGLGVSTHCSELSSFQVAARSPGQNRTCLRLVDELGLFFIWGDRWGQAAHLKEAAVSTQTYACPPDRQTVHALPTDRLVSFPGWTHGLFHTPRWFPVLL